MLAFISSLTEDTVISHVTLVPSSCADSDRLNRLKLRNKMNSSILKLPFVRHPVTVLRKLTSMENW